MWSFFLLTSNLKEIFQTQTLVNSILKENILWDQVTILVKITNLNSSKSDLNIQINDSSYTFESKENNDKYFDVLEIRIL